MKVRILTEQTVHRSQPDRRYLASGCEVDLPNAHAAELLNRGEAEPVDAAAPANRSEKRPAHSKTEKR